jgi:hypothetical protein
MAEFLQRGHALALSDAQRRLFPAGWNEWPLKDVPWMTAILGTHTFLAFEA